LEVLAAGLAGRGWAAFEVSPALTANDQRDGPRGDPELFCKDPLGDPAGRAATQFDDLGFG